MLLQLEQLQKYYRSSMSNVTALDGVSLAIQQGEFVAIRVKSGCGKTTLLLIAGGLLSPDGGRVRLDNCNPYELSSEERAKLRANTVGFVFQQFHLIPYLTVLENVLAANLATGTKTETGQATDRAMHLIEQFGLKDRLHHTPSQLSTGERQRTALARALQNSPKIILADEPTGNLDRENSEIVLAHLKNVAKETGVLLVTHDDFALKYADRVIHMKDGNIVQPDESLLDSSN